MSHARGHGDDAAGPSLRAIPFLKLAGLGSESRQLLTEKQRHQLLRLATVRDIPSRTIVYRMGAPADSVFIVGSGVVKSFRDLPSGRRRIALFLFPHDLFGLAKAGHYVNTAQTVTPSRVYEIALPALTHLLRDDPEMEFQFLCKTIHVIREAQQHIILMGRRDAAGRLAMLLHLLQQQLGPPRGHADIPVPMTRSDIANYLGLSLEAVVRASRELERQGIVEFVDRHHARVLDRPRFAALAAEL